MSYESEMKKKGLDAALEEQMLAKEYMKNVGINQYLLEQEDKKRQSEAIMAQNKQFEDKIRGLTQEELEALRSAITIDPDKNPEEFMGPSQLLAYGQTMKKIEGMTAEELEALIAAITKSQEAVNKFMEQLPPITSYNFGRALLKLADKRRQEHPTFIKISENLGKYIGEYSDINKKGRR